MNHIHKSLESLQLTKLPKKGIQFQTSRDGLESPLKAFTTGEQGTVNADLKLTHFGLKTPIQI